MSGLNLIEQMRASVQGAIPGAHVDLEWTPKEGGLWTLDVQLNHHSLEIHWFAGEEKLHLYDNNGGVTPFDLQAAEAPEDSSRLLEWLKVKLASII